MPIDLDALHYAANCGKGRAGATSIIVAADDLAAIITELRASRKLLSVARRKMAFIVRDYSGDKEARAWIAEYDATEKPHAD